MPDLSDAFSELAQTEMVVEIAVLFAAFLAPTVLRNLVDGFVPVDVPAEAYGVVVAGVGGAYAPDYNESIMLGGGLYSVDKAAERFDLKSSVQGVGA